ncbi:hypothetical protein TRIP_B250262 [uncultured Desulfatiglans sp.]|nr:hypothetical protein TRIP_B250262 [uncultured Desulfatiglans sp.]
METGFCREIISGWDRIGIPVRRFTAGIEGGEPPARCGTGQGYGIIVARAGFEEDRRGLPAKTRGS